MHHLDNWIKRDKLDVTCFIISLLNAQYVSDVNTSILRSLRLICWVISWVVLLWFDVLVLRCGLAVVVWYPYAGWGTSRKLLRMDVLTSETCWALNNEIIKQMTSSWSLFIQLYYRKLHNTYSQTQLGRCPWPHSRQLYSWKAPTFWEVYRELQMWAFFVTSLWRSLKPTRTCCKETLYMLCLFICRRFHLYTSYIRTAHALSYIIFIIVTLFFCLRVFPWSIFCKTPSALCIKIEYAFWGSDSVFLISDTIFLLIPYSLFWTVCLHQNSAFKIAVKCHLWQNSLNISSCLSWAS